MFKTTLAAVALAALSGAALAAEPGQVRGFVGLDLGSGGDTLANIRYTDGSTQDMKAGDGVQFKGGLDYRVDEDWSVVGSLGYHLYTTNAKNGRVTFQRFPVELMAKYNLNPKARIGFGVRVPFAANVSSSGAASQVGEFSPKGKKGLIVDGEYLFGKVGVSLRWTNESYTLGSQSIDGTHFSVGLNYYF
ncbi:outer membrane beta-barrel protein [Ideonella paludis]|uniref:Transporter n=2 Tax=Ideonella paludis TaxID=1233411 RepID=A0ABS5E0G1_9BURK|nr:transporter [Ideonella paludis]MBQ0936886.1 transporter [Ideonella paludis]